MVEIYLFRWLHILAGLAWVGEVITINFVIVPALKSLPKADQSRFISAVFPRVFRLATTLALVSIIAGIVMSILQAGGSMPVLDLRSSRGIGIFGGGFLALLLLAFHLLVERRLKPLVVGPDDKQVEQIVRLLGIIPRAGLVVILTIALLMFFGSSGLSY